MSLKTSLIKMAIKWTPNTMIIWVANIILKGIAELKDFNFDLEARTVYAQILLLGEAEAIEVWLEKFEIINEDEARKFIIHQAQSNRLWLSNLLSRIVGKSWKIPELPQFAAEIELISDLLKAERAEQEDSNPEREDIYVDQ
jgi:hypothetical protein